MCKRQINMQSTKPINKSSRTSKHQSPSHDQSHNQIKKAKTTSIHDEMNRPPNAPGRIVGVRVPAQTTSVLPTRKKSVGSLMQDQCSNDNTVQRRSKHSLWELRRQSPRDQELPQQDTSTPINMSDEVTQQSLHSPRPQVEVVVVDDKRGGVSYKVNRAECEALLQVSEYFKVGVFVLVLSLREI
jgi:hypothetical protein